MTMITKEQAQAWKFPKSSHGVHLNSGTLNEFCDAVIALHERVDRLTEAATVAAQELRVIAGMDLIGASAVAYNAARPLEAILKETTRD